MVLNNLQEAWQNATQTANEVVDEAQETVDEALEKDESIQEKAKDVVKEATKDKDVDENSSSKEDGKNGKDKGQDSSSSQNDKGAVNAVKNIAKGKDPTGMGGLPDTEEGVDKAQKFRNKNKVIKKATPGSTKALENREKALEAKNQLEKQEQKLKNRDKGTPAEELQERFTQKSKKTDNPGKSQYYQKLAETFEGRSGRFVVNETGQGAQIKKLTYTNPETGKELSRSEALERIQKRQEKVQETLKAQEKEFKEFTEAQTSPDQTFSDRVEQRAEKVELDQVTDTDSAVTEAGNQVLESGKKAFAYGETLFKEEGNELIASTVPGGKSPEDVVEERIARDLVLQEQGVERNIQERAFSRLSSPVGMALTGVAGGLAFRTGGRALSSVPKAGNYLQKTYQAGGAAVGIAEGVKTYQEAQRKLEQGETAEAGGEVVKFGSATAGFIGGSKIFSSRFGARQGTSSIGQRNVVRKTGDTVRGQGKAQGVSRVVTPRVRDIITRNKNPRTDLVKLEAEYSIRGNQALGSYNVRAPGRQRNGVFETVSRETNSGRTRQGNKFQETRDISRFTEESRFFKNRKDVESYSRTVRQGQREGSPTDVLNVFDNVAIRSDSSVKVVDLTSTTRSGESFGSVRNYVVRKGSGSGKSRGGSSLSSNQKSSTESESTTENLEDFKANIRELLDSETESFIQQGKDSPVSTVPSSEQGEDTSSTQGNEEGYSLEQESSEVQEAEGQINQNVKSLKSVKRRSQATTQTSQTREQDDLETYNLETPQVGTQTGQKKRGANLERNVQATPEKLDISEDLELTAGTVTGSKFKMKEIANLEKSLKLQNQSLKTGIRTRLRSRPGMARVPDLEGEEQGINPGVSNQETGIEPGFETGLDLDWISENRIEQKGGTATFVIDQEALKTQEEIGQFQGIKAEEEEKRETRKENNTTNIW